LKTHVEVRIEKNLLQAMARFVVYIDILGLQDSGEMMNRTALTFMIDCYGDWGGPM